MNIDKEVVYLDTSVPSAYYDKRVSWRMEYTQEWWKNEIHKFDIYISPIVIAEINNTRNKEIRSALLDIVKDFKQFQFNNEIEIIASGYLNQKIIPKSSAVDSLHIALASYYKADFLLTWNCSHMAEAHRRRKIKLYNSSIGIYIPEIVTPMELHGGNQNGDI